ncbi:hypothetical protein PVK06_008991 [Gossypium arboreum]|uniref:Uncharacterized protein n=1 Tax=Gossypium arboreum TaxID=29729 RepID=A0ABR0QLA3_GOSAR|nr:hypothetical protein PVK06_008991 [Gossypium arboreum]
MPEYPDKPPYDSYKLPSCETTKTTNSKELVNMSDIMAQMIKMMQEICKVLPPRKEDMFDVHNSDHENLDIIDDHNEIMVELKDELTINMELKLVVNESVKELIHFLAIKEEAPTKEVEEFDSCSFDNGNKV